MLAIKLARVGRKNAPTYRIVVTPKTRDPWAKSTEIVGHYNPRMNPSVIELNRERLEYWLSVGACPTDTVKNLLISEGLLKEKKTAVSNLTTKRKAKMAAADIAKVEAEKAAKAKAAEDKKAAEEAAKAEKEAAKAAKVAAEEAAKAEKEAAAEAAKALVAEEAPEEAPAEAATETPEATA